MVQALWQPKVEKCQKILQDSLNPAWLLPAEQLPPADQLNVASFADSCKLLTPRELEITQTNATDLVAQMAAGKLSAVETATAFLKRAHVGHQLLNFAVEFLVDDAMARAAELDAHFKSTGKVVGPLHGVPISVKEHVALKGRICHSCYVAWIDNVAEEDALLVTLLKNAGAIIHVRTNEPQSLMHIDCDNVIYGPTVNPHNRKLTSGGSSGGEGASLGFRCAAIGIGTDIGGSVRVPAAFCGAYGLRTTALRNPYKGVLLAGDGQESIRCIIGPLANSVGDLNLAQKAVLDQEPWEEETSLVPLPWKEVPAYKPDQITVGVIWDDGVVHPHPPTTRGLKHAVSKLKAASVKVVDFEPYEHSRGWDILSALYFPDAAKYQKDLLQKGGEPVAALTEWAFSQARPEPITVVENWDLNVQREAYRAEYHRVMKERGVDFILCPAYVGVAAELATGQYWLYTAIWNILDQPAVTFPTGLKADPSVDVVEADYKPRSAQDEREFKKYVPERFIDAPIPLQVVGKHFRDEETVAAAELISGIVGA
ncbi:amidase signature domain-containing protein [Exophiala viscosa]|uniref:amidase signature domain-containing protein n=1 Tax=Exophiala viscosa TaxID=2486360 RepID=UPI00218F2684|nr:amidase signature domain-containing protein [Exophiala viscosa]